MREGFPSAATRQMSVEYLENRTLLSVALVSDINQVPILSTSLTQLADNNGTLFFVDSDGITGNELWKSDGTASGTVLVKDINAGAGSSNPTGLTALNSIVYFSATDGIHGTGLWRSDGTSAGTYQIFAGGGAAMSSPKSLVAFGGKLYFFAQDSSASYPGSLWTLNGSAAVEVMNLKDGVGDAPASLTVFNGSLYFLNTPGELLQSDGTAAGTSVVQTVPGITSLANLTVAGNRMFFTSAGNQLWTSDGTTAGTYSVATIGTGTSSSPSISNLTALGNKILFTGNDGSSGAELWSSDGSSAGEVTDIRSGSAGSNPSYLTAMGGKVYFQATDSTHGVELWSSDGTYANTQLVADVNPGIGSSTPVNLFSTGNRLYFGANGGAGAAGVWTSDGTAAGTTLLKAYSAYSSAAPGPFAASDARIFFPATDSTYGTQLWSTDGTTANTQLVKDIYTANGDSIPIFGSVVNGKAIFLANNGTGSSVYATDGTAAGTIVLNTLGGGRKSPSLLGTAGGYEYFEDYNTSTINSELWRTDGTVSGTVQLASSQYSFGNPLAYNGYAYFSSSQPNGGLWRSDGTATGTKLALTSGINSVTAVFNGVMYGTGSDSTHGNELWRSDGTPAGTYLVDDIAPGTNSSSPSDLTVVGTRMYFFATDGTGTHQLYVSDGTASGTSPLFASSGFGEGAGASGGKFYFSSFAPGRAGDLEPWVTDGTVAGTHLITDIASETNGNGNPSNFTDLNGILLFMSEDTQYSVPRLYRTDGTAAGTYLVQNVVPRGSGVQFGNAWILLNGDYYFFSQYPSTLGLWRTDGTTVGTYMVSNLSPGQGAGSYESSIVLGNTVLFGANDGLHGDEVYLYTPGNTPLTVTSTTYSIAGGLPTLTYSFNRPVVGSAGSGGLTLTNLTSNSAAFYSAATVSSGQLTLTIPAYVGGNLPDGNYQAVLAAGAAADANGNPLANDFTFNFFVLNGDVNGDRHVDATDLSIATADLGLTGQSYSQGDVNGDGSVTSADLAIINANMNAWLPAPGAVTLSTSTSGNTLSIRRESSYVPIVDIFSGSPVPATPLYRMYLNAVTSFNISGGSTNVSVVVDFSNGIPLPNQTFALIGVGTGNSFGLIGTTGTHNVSYVPGSATFDSSVFNLSNVTGLSFNGGTPIVVNDRTYNLSIAAVTVSLPSLTVGSGIKLLSISTITIGSGGTLQVPSTYLPSGQLDHADRYLFNCPTLSLIGQLDLGDNDMYGVSQLYSTMNSWLQQGFGNGITSGSSGIISTAATSDPSHLSALACILNQSAPNVPLYSKFDTFSLGSAVVLVKYTWFGDANLSGMADGSDYSRIDNGSLNHLTGWFNGDFNYDGIVDGSDYTLIDNAFNQQGASLASQVAMPAARVDSTHSAAKLFSRLPIDKLDFAFSTAGAFPSPAGSGVIARAADQIFGPAGTEVSLIAADPRKSGKGSVDAIAFVLK